MTLYFKQIGTDNIIKVSEYGIYFIVERGKFKHDGFHALCKPRKMTIQEFCKIRGNYKYVSRETFKKGGLKNGIKV